MHGLAALTGKALARMSCTVVTRLASGTRDTRDTRDTRYSILISRVTLILTGVVGMLVASSRAECKATNTNRTTERKGEILRVASVLI